MGTRGNVVVQDRGENLVRIYRQFDSYLSGMGAGLKEMLGEQPRIVNGYGSGDDSPLAFNGMGCLAAYVIAHLKDGIGNIYIQVVDEEPDGLFIEYVYTLYESGGKQPEVAFGYKPGELFIRVETIDWDEEKKNAETVKRADGTTYESVRYPYKTIYDGPFKEFDPVALDKTEREEEVPA